jgi:hypothetical protein
MEMIERCIELRAQFWNCIHLLAMLLLQQHQPVRGKGQGSGVWGGGGAQSSVGGGVTEIISTHHLQVTARASKLTTVAALAAGIPGSGCTDAEVEGLRGCGMQTGILFSSIAFAASSFSLKHGVK